MTNFLTCYFATHPMWKGFWDLISLCCEVVARTSTLNFSEHTVNYRRKLSDEIYLWFQSVNFLSQFISHSTSETELLCSNSELPRQFWSKEFYLDFLTRRTPQIRNHNIMRRGQVFLGFICLFFLYHPHKHWDTKPDPSSAFSCSYYNLCQWNETSENFNTQYNLWKTVIYCVTLTFSVFCNLIGRHSSSLLHFWQSKSQKRGCMTNQSKCKICQMQWVKFSNKIYRLR